MLKFFQTEIISLGFGVPVTSACVHLLLDMSPEDLSRILKVVVIMALVVVGGVAIPTNYILSRRIKSLLDRFYGAPTCPGRSRTPFPPEYQSPETISSRGKTSCLPLGRTMRKSRDGNHYGIGRYSLF